MQEWLWHAISDAVVRFGELTFLGCSRLTQQWIAPVLLTTTNTSHEIQVVLVGEHRSNKNTANQTNSNDNRSQRADRSTDSVWSSAGCIVVFNVSVINNFVVVGEGRVSVVILYFSNELIGKLCQTHTVSLTTGWVAWRVAVKVGRDILSPLKTHGISGEKSAYSIITRHCNVSGNTERQSVGDIAGAEDCKIGGASVSNWFLYSFFVTERILKRNKKQKKWV